MVFVADARIIRKNELGETTKTFNNSSPYEGLKIGDVVEVEEENDSLRDYLITSMKWDFTHFGDTLVIEIELAGFKPPSSR